VTFGLLLAALGVLAVGAAGPTAAVRVHHTAALVEIGGDLAVAGGSRWPIQVAEVGGRLRACLLRYPSISGSGRVGRARRLRRGSGGPV